MSVKRKDSKNRVLKEGEYQKSNGSYEYRWKDRKGQSHSIYGKTLDKLREKELDVMRDILNNANYDDEKITLDDLFERWVRLKRGIKEVTFNTYKHDYNRYVRPVLGQIQLVSIKSSDVRAFYNDLCEKEGFSYRTITNIHRVLHQIFDIGVDDDLIRKNPSTKAMKDFKAARKPEEKVTKSLTYKQQELFEKFITTSREYSERWPIYIVMLWTGLRIGEAAGLRWCDIDFKTNTITVDHSLAYYGDDKFQHNRFVITSPKTSSSIRKVFMIPKVRQALLAQKTILVRNDLKCNVVIDGYTDFVFLSRLNGPRNPLVVNNELAGIVKKCNNEIMDRWRKEEHDDGEEPITLPRMTAHWLRHTFATRCCEADINPKALQMILGHSTYQLTMDIYAEANDDMRKSQLIYLKDFYDTKNDAASST